MDRATFTETVDHALDEPEAREYLAEQLAAAMFDALINADERSRLILAPLAGQSPDAPDAAIVRGLEPRIEAALDHPKIAAARLRLVEAAHDTLVGLDDADSTVRIEDDTLVVNGADLLRAALDAVEPRFGQLGACPGRCRRRHRARLVPGVRRDRRRPPDDRPPGDDPAARRDRDGPR